MTGDLGRLQAMSITGKSGANAYDAAKSQMSSNRSAALASALGRADAIGAPQSFNSYSAPRITGAFDRGIGQMGAMAGAQGAYSGAINGAANSYASGLRDLQPLLEEQMKLKYSPTANEDSTNKALIGLIDKMTARSSITNKLNTVNTKAMKTNTTTAITSGDLAKTPTGAAAREILKSGNYIDAYNDLQNIQTYLTTGKDPSGKTKAALKSIGVKNAKDLDLATLQQLITGYYGQGE